MQDKISTIINYAISSAIELPKDDTDGLEKLISLYAAQIMELTETK